MKKFIFWMALTVPFICANSAIAGSCTASGNTTYCDDGTSYTQSGNTTYHSDGTSTTRSGNTTYGSDGTSCTSSGNTVYCN